MSGETHNQWNVIGGSIRGATHIRKDLPNQDAWGAWQAVSGQPVALGVVADGHGSPRCFRSAIGARIAVEVAHQVVESVAVELVGSPAEVLEELPGMLVHAWRKRVAAHLLDHPLRNDDFPGAIGSAARQKLVLEPIEIYGTTLIACLATSRHFITLQVGDGDVLLVTEDGSCVRVFERDVGTLGSETRSLCEVDPAVVRFDLRELGPELAPALVLMSTDGVSNAFRSDRDFFQLATDLAHELRRRCLEEIGADLPGWLEDFSREGSGDDVTVCLLARRRGLRPKTDRETSVPDLPPTIVSAPATTSSTRRGGDFRRSVQHVLGLLPSLGEEK